MKKCVLMGINGEEETISKVEKLFGSRSILKYNRHSPFDIHLYFYFNSVDYIEIKQYSHEHGLKIQELCRTDYDDYELEQIPFYQLIFSDFEPDVLNAEYYGIKYLSNCEWCKKYATIDGKCLIPVKQTDSYDICKVPPEIIVSANMLNSFINSNLTGIEWDDTFQYRNRKESTSKRLRIVNTLPPMSKDTWKEDIECPVCHEKGVFLRSFPVYTLDDFKDAFDFNLSIEYDIHFHYSENNKDASVNYCSQYIIVSKKAKEIIEANSKKENFCFNPITYKDLVFKKKM